MHSGSVGHATQTTMLHHVHRKKDVNATVASTLEVFVMLHRSQSCPMCRDRNVVPTTRAGSVEVLVLLHRTPSCIMCVDTAAVLGSRACILEA
jgi:hypothetical protein